MTVKKPFIFAVLSLAAASVAWGQDRPAYGNDDDKAYCQYVTELAKGQALQFEIPNATLGVTQPNTGTAAQTFAGIGGSLAGIRKGQLTNKLADENCRLYITQDAVTNNVKYAMDGLQKDALSHRIEIVKQSIIEIDALIAGSQKAVDAHTTTRMALYALVTAKQSLVAQQANLQGQIAGMYVPYMDPAPLYRLVDREQGQQESMQKVQGHLNKQSNWDLAWQVGAHKTVQIPGAPSITTVGGNNSGFYAGFTAMYNIGSRNINKHFDKSVTAYGDWKRVENNDIVTSANNIQGQVIDLVAATAKHINQITESQKALEADIETIKGAETNVGQTYENQLVSDRLMLKIELQDAEFRLQEYRDYLAYNFPGVPELSNGQVSLTFDDGFVSQVNAALPILDKAGYKGTFYIISGHLATEGYMTWEQVQSLQADGQEVGSHTVNHKHLSQIPFAEQQAEIVGSVPQFEAHGIHPVSLAYPFGDYNDGAIKAAKEAGFRSGRTVNALLSGQDKFRLQGYPITNRTTPGELKIAIDKARRDGTWLILIWHRIDEKSDKEINAKHELLQFVVDYLKSTNTKVVTVDEATRGEAVSFDNRSKKDIPIPAAKGPVVTGLLKDVVK
jgi:peptidoglycan/xylan/chitin deacetylase (PgdA/CDA1 family)